MTAIDRLIYTQHEWEKVLKDIQPSEVVVLSDTTTAELCVPLFKERYSAKMEFHHFSVDPCEASKSLDTADALYAAFMDAGIDRDALLLNVGGGVVTDLGGFIGSTYKRGINIIHVPTTHLGMVDAALGGKNGVNFDGYKNQIGTFYQASAVVIDPTFLSTLPKNALLSGWVETVKHALIADASLWEIIRPGNALVLAKSPDIIKRSVEIKLNIAAADSRDHGLRQALNFGHTIGHAIEAESDLMHGEAVAFGIVAEAYLSMKHSGLSAQQLEQIVTYIKALNLPKPPYALHDHQLFERMLQDKKTTRNAIQFALIPSIGKVTTGINIGPSDISASLAFANEKLLT